MPTRSVFIESHHSAGKDQFIHIRLPSSKAHSPCCLQPHQHGLDIDAVDPTSKNGSTDRLRMIVAMFELGMSNDLFIVVNSDKRSG